jgi:Co/Zn/Cd efflux system component
MQRIERVARVVAIQTALATAALHLLWTVPRLLEPGSVTDSRPPLFVAVALVLVAVAVAVFRSYPYRRLSALGGGTLATLLVGYVGYHGSNAAERLASDPLALAAVAVEAVGVVAFAALYVLHHPDRLGATPPAGDDADTTKRGDN